MPNPADAALGELPLTCGIPTLVLDTNVVLDWLVFREPTVAPLAAAVTGGSVRWIATAAMRAEMAHVLGRGLALARQVDSVKVLQAWDAHAALQAEPQPQPLRCIDPADQLFIDLAIGARARWLVSRDRAVLKLARRAARSGVAIVEPQAWQPASR